MSISLLCILARLSSIFFSDEKVSDEAINTRELGIFRLISSQILSTPGPNGI